MKKQYLGKFTLILMIPVLFLSCSTVKTAPLNTEEDQILGSAIALAQTYADQGEYEKSIEIYNTVNKSINDYRITYNLSVLYDQTGDTELAYDTAKAGWVFFNDGKLFLNAMLSYALKLEDNEKLIFVYSHLLKLNEQDHATRQKLCMAYIGNNQLDLALENAMYLWDNMVYNKKTAEILYAIDPEEWHDVYAFFN